MAVKLLGIDKSGANFVQLQNGTLSTFGNSFNAADSTHLSYASPRRAVIACERYASGVTNKMQLFAVNKETDSSNAYIWKTFNGLQKLTITTSDTWVNGDDVNGSTSGASGTVRDTDGSTYLVVELDASSADFQSPENIDDGGSKSGSTSAVTGSDLGDAVVPDHVWTNPGGAEASHDLLGKGFYRFVDSDGIEKIAYLFRATSTDNTAKFCKYNPATDTWSNHTLTGADATFQAINMASIMYKNQVYIADYGTATGDDKFKVVDFAAGTVTLLTGINASDVRVSNWGVDSDGYLYLSGGGGGNHMLWRLEAGTFSLKYNAYLGGDPVIGTCVFEAPDGTLIVIWSQGALTQASSFNKSTWSPTWLTLPSGYSSRTYQMMTVFRDRNTNGPTGATKVNIICQSYYGSGNLAQLECAGPTSWTDLGSSAGGGTFHPCETAYGDGDAYYEDGMNFATTPGPRTAVPGGQKFFLRVFGSGGSVDVKYLVQKGGSLTGEYGTGDDEFFDATLGDVSGGSLKDSDKTWTVTSDGSEYSAIWQFLVDGAELGAWYERRPFVST